MWIFWNRIFLKLWSALTVFQWEQWYLIFLQEISNFKLNFFSSKYFRSLNIQNIPKLSCFFSHKHNWTILNVFLIIFNIFWCLCATTMSLFRFNDFILVLLTNFNHPHNTNDRAHVHRSVVLIFAQKHY